MEALQPAQRKRKRQRQVWSRPGQDASPEAVMALLDLGLRLTGRVGSAASWLLITRQPNARAQVPARIGRS